MEDGKSRERESFLSELERQAVEVLVVYNSHRSSLSLAPVPVFTSSGLSTSSACYPCYQIIMMLRICSCVLKITVCVVCCNYSFI
jgi:hypothetical protein